MDMKKLTKNFKKLLLKNKTYCLKKDKIISFEKCNLLKCNREKKCREKNNKIYNKI